MEYLASFSNRSLKQSAAGGKSGTVDGESHKLLVEDTFWKSAKYTRE